MADKTEDLSSLDVDDITASDVEEHITDLRVINNILSALTNLGNELNIGPYREPSAIGIESLTTEDNTLIQTTSDGSVRRFEDIKLGGQLWNPAMVGSGALVASSANELTFDDPFEGFFTKEETESSVKLSPNTALPGNAYLDYDKYASIVYSSTLSNNMTIVGNESHLPFNRFEVNNILQWCRKSADGFLELAPGRYFLAGSIMLRGGQAWRLRIIPYPIAGESIEWAHGVSGLSHVSTASNRLSRLARPSAILEVVDGWTKYSFLKENGTTNAYYGGGLDVAATNPLNTNEWLWNIHSRLEVWKIG